MRQRYASHEPHTCDQGQPTTLQSISTHLSGNGVQDDELPAHKQEHANRVAMGFNKYVKQPKEIFTVFVSVLHFLSGVGVFDFLYFLSLLEPLFQGFRPTCRHKSGFGVHNTDRRRLYAKSKIKQKIKNPYTPQPTNQTAHRSNECSSICSRGCGRGLSKFGQRPHSNRRFGQLHRVACRSDRSQARTGRRRSIKIKIAAKFPYLNQDTARSR